MIVNVANSDVVGWKKLGAWQERSCYFQTNSCKSPTEEIVGTQDFSFASNFSQSGGFPALCWKFSEKNTIFGHVKI